MQFAYMHLPNLYQNMIVMFFISVLHFYLINFCGISVLMVHTFFFIYFQKFLIHG